MPQEVYNLGRATGLSAWEIYVRQSLLSNPDIEPLSEREWLAESIGIGKSLLLKITAETKDEGVHCREFPMPANSLLCAPNTIVGSFFYGEATADSTGWCTRVTDYGPEIANNSSSSPVNGYQTAHSLPKSITEVSAKNQKRMMQYIKIQDAIFLQDGVWSDSEASEPKKTFVPDITKPSLLRITFEKQITEDFYILLTGFVTRAIIKGEVGFDMGSVMPDDPAEAATYRPENGNFLGPLLYPWASKVVFTYPAVLTYLLRDGVTSGSKNLKITASPDDTQTSVEISKIVAGPGVQVDDASTSEDPAKTITISSRIQSNNNYIEIAEQDAYNTSNGISQVPTAIKGSPATPGLGVGITPPTNPGDPHIIGAKIIIDDKAKNYLGVSQSAPGDASQPATTLTPSRPTPGPGIAIKAPEIPGDEFEIISKIETAGTGSNYIKIEQTIPKDLSQAATTIIPSRALAGKGVGVSQPSDAGGDHIISAIIQTVGEGKNYINVTQEDNKSRDANTISTTLAPSRLVSGDGITILQPNTPGEDIEVRARIQTKGNGSKYLKVEQSANATTMLAPSRLVSESPISRITISGPTNPGDDVRIAAKVGFTPHNGISILDDPASGMTHIGSAIAISGNGALGIGVTQGSIIRSIDKVNTSDANAVKTLMNSVDPSTIDNVPTILTVAKHIVDARNQEKIENGVVTEKAVLTITYGDTPGKDITYYIDVEEISRRIMSSGALQNFMQDMVNKIFGGGTIDKETGHIKWLPEGTENIKVPLCDLNIYSNDGQGDIYENALRSRKENTTNDIRLK